MARVSPKQHSFARGEVSPKLYGRQDTELYYTALELSRNYVVDGRGILERRPGTKFIGRTKNDGKAALLPFVYDQAQSYILELGNEYLRAWFNDGQVLDGGNPSEESTPYSDDEVDDLSYTQARDVMWIAHGNHPPSTVKRVTASTFELETFQTRDGPYLDTNPDLDAKLSVTANGVSANVGRGTFSDGDPLSNPDIPNDLIVGSVIKIWDGSGIRTITVQSIDTANNRIESNWSGAPIVATEQWSYDGNPAPDDITLSFEGVSGVTTGTLTAVGGHTPFDAARDTGRWVRVLEEDTEAEESAALEERFEWHSFKIVSVQSPTEATIEWDGGNLPETSDWRLGAFFPGNYPSVCTFHENRLCFAVRNRIYMSAPGDYDNFSPSEVDSSVLPDNAITVSIPAVNAKKGAVSDVTFIQSVGFQLIVGTPSGLHTIQSTSFGEAIKPDTVTRRAQDSRGAALGEPIMIGESVIYLHSSRQKLMGTYYKDGYDRLGAQDLSLPADHIAVAKIKGVTWQEEPHSIAWCHFDDGTIAGLTIQPEEKVQAWHTHRLGGSFVSGGSKLPAQVESMATIPAQDGGDDRLHLIVRRTINGSEARFIEIMQPYWTLGDDLRSAWFVDGGLKYEGNVDPAKTLTFTGTGTAARSVVSSFTAPAFLDGQTLVFNDGVRWQHGRVSAVDENNDFTWTPTMPNSPPGPADGRWHNVDDAWVQLSDEDEIDVFAPTYVEPANQIDVAAWSTEITSLSGLSDYEGERLDMLVDGFPVLKKMVDAGSIASLPPCHIAVLGFGYLPQAKLLSIEAGSQSGSAQGKQRPVYEMVMDVLETRNLEGGTGLPSSYEKSWEQFDPITFPDDFVKIYGEPDPLFSGLVRMIRDEQGDIDNPSVSWRQPVPLPSMIRGIITRLSQSDGR